ncbi:MAG: hypothetical protein ISS71_04585 [Phycisphaerae bacterium]|nr:hypothetical protein [Phycisphaerae bacterium]
MTKKLKNPRAAGGFNLIELVIVIASAAILTLTVGVFLGNGQKSWNHLFNRVYGDMAIDSFTAHKVFDSICRKASLRKYVIEDEGQTLELYYWDSGSSALTPENYARFYSVDNVLYVRHGKLQAGTWQPDTSTALTPINIANNVESIKFETQGTSIRMFLAYTGENTMPVVCSTVRHND